jgi:hypothetical protein
MDPLQVSGRLAMYLSIASRDTEVLALLKYYPSHISSLGQEKCWSAIRVGVLRTMQRGGKRKSQRNLSGRQGKEFRIPMHASI